MSENLSPVTAETSTNEDDIDSSKSKSKKKALGTFIVETEPPKKKESLWNSKPRAETTEPKAKPEKAGTAPEAPEDLESEEKVAAIQQLAAARRLEVAAEADTAEIPATETELAAATAFLVAAEALGDSEAAFQQIAAELVAPVETETTAKNDEIDTEQLHEGEIDLHAMQPAAETETEDEPEPVTPPAAASSTPTGPSPSAGGSGSGGAGNTSPPPLHSPGGPGGRPPAGNPPTGPGGPPRPHGPTGPYGPVGPNFNTAPTTPVRPAEATVPLEAARANERRALADGLIVGGIVGYLYGRRRGRIKTEKRLVPVQRKLEKQVKTLQAELLQTETAVRQQARKLQQERPQVAAQVTERLQRVVRQEAVKQPERQAGQAVVQPERIGQVLVAASASAGAERLKPAAKTSNQEVVSAKKRAETMSRGELLALSETVQVDGTSLRQVYETQLVSEKGLRRLITEHLRGGNVARALRRELVEHQIDFERDPILRDRGNGDGQSNVSGAGKTALSGLLAQVGASDQAQAEPIGAVPNKREPKTKPAAVKAKNRQQALIDSALLTLIIVLIFVIAAVLMRSR